MDGWRVDPNQWSAGKTHWIKQQPESKWDDYDPVKDERTLCGKSLSTMPGRRMVAAPDAVITCQGCKQKIINMARDAERAARYEADRIEREREWAEGRSQYEELLGQRRAFYDEYINSERWRRKRDRRLKHDNYLCQGCLERRAETVHHLTYKRLGDEMVFDLISLCWPCHNKIHGREKI